MPQPEIEIKFSSVPVVWMVTEGFEHRKDTTVWVVASLHPTESQARREVECLGPKFMVVPWHFERGAVV